MGGPTSFSYTYDDLYRLTSSTGEYRYNPDTTERYTFAQSYDTIHNIASKTQRHVWITSGGSEIEQHATTYDWAYSYGSAKPHAATLIGDRTFTYDANGNQLGWDHNQNGLF